MIIAKVLVEPCVCIPVKNVPTIYRRIMRANTTISASVGDKFIVDRILES